MKIYDENGCVWITTKEACKHMRVSAPTLISYRNKPNSPIVYNSVTATRVYYNKESLDEFMSSFKEAKDAKCICIKK